jgi:hypothetical protein
MPRLVCLLWVAQRPSADAFQAALCNYANGAQAIGFR